METPKHTRGPVRRNGQKPACEPCRTSKLRCDHGQPRCARCEHRGVADRCYYHPAPMTGRPKKSRIPLSSGVSIPSASPPSIERLRSLQPKIQPSSPPSTNHAELDRSTGVVSMGNHGLPFNDMEWTASRRENTALTRNGIITSSKPAVISTTLIEEGVELLRFICSSFTVIDELIRRWLDEVGVCTCSLPINKFSWYAIRNLLESTGESPTDRQLQDISRDVFASTIQPYSLPSTFSDLCATRLRWETVGIYCAFAGTIVSDSRDQKDVFDGSSKWTTNRRLLIDEMFRAVLRIEGICDQLEQVNDLTLQILLQTTAWATWCCGDDSYRAWRLMGDLASVVFALGYHKGANQDKKTPRFVVELRRRALVIAHNLDKGLSAFVGRPPRLSTRYCVMEMVSDVSDAVLMGPISAMEEAEARLDNSGWNTEGVVHPASVSRAWILVNDFREQVLELSLSTKTENLEPEVQNLLRRSASTWNSLPFFMRYKEASSDNQPVPFSMQLFNIHLEQLYNEFLLNKMLVHTHHFYRDECLRISHQTVALASRVIKKREWMSAHRLALEWMVIFYVMPCACVLMLELIRQNQQPHCTLVISRSTLIRDLSVFFSDCDFLIEPGQSNYETFRQAQTVFSRALDLILNNNFPLEPATSGLNKISSGAATFQASAPAIPTPPMTESTYDNTPVSAADINNDNFLDNEFASWLDSYNLQMDSWMDVFYPSEGHGL